MTWAEFVLWANLMLNQFDCCGGNRKPLDDDFGLETEVAEEVEVADPVDWDLIDPYDPFYNLPDPNDRYWGSRIRPGHLFI